MMIMMMMMILCLVFLQWLNFSMIWSVPAPLKLRLLSCQAFFIFPNSWTTAESINVFNQSLSVITPVKVCCLQRERLLRNLQTSKKPFHQTRNTWVQVSQSFSEWPLAAVEWIATLKDDGHGHHAPVWHAPFLGHALVLGHAPFLKCAPFLGHAPFVLLAVTAELTPLAHLTPTDQSGSFFISRTSRSVKLKLHFHLH